MKQEVKDFQIWLISWKYVNNFQLKLMVNNWDKNITQIGQFWIYKIRNYIDIQGWIIFISFVFFLLALELGMNCDKLNEAMRQSDELNSSISSEKHYTV